MATFTVRWWVEFWEKNPPIHYLIDEEFEARNDQALLGLLDDEIQNGELTPESKIPEYWSLGNFNIEYVLIRNESDDIVYEDSEFARVSVPEENKL